MSRRGAGSGTTTTSPRLTSPALHPPACESESFSLAANRSMRAPGSRSRALRQDHERGADGPRLRGGAGEPGVPVRPRQAPRPPRTSTSAVGRAAPRVAELRLCVRRGVDGDESRGARRPVRREPPEGVHDAARRDMLEGLECAEVLVGQMPGRVHRGAKFDIGRHILLWALIHGRQMRGAGVGSCWAGCNSSCIRTCACASCCIVAAVSVDWGQRCGCVAIHSYLMPSRGVEMSRPVTTRAASGGGPGPARAGPEASSSRPWPW